MGWLAVAASASAATIRLDAYNTSAPDLDLTVEILVDGGMASFDFRNASSGESAGAVVGRIYFESGLGALGLSDPTIVGGAGVSFGFDYPGPGSPPGGNLVDWTGELAAIGAAAPPPQNGLGAGDDLLITFAYSGELAPLLAALTDENGDSRIAAHVLDCIGGSSCAAVSEIPLPAGLWLLLGGLGALFAHRRR